MNMQEMTDEQLREAAKRFKVDAPRTANRIELEDLVQVAIEKRRLELEDKARKEREKDIALKLGLDPQTKARPAPETLAIAQSEKVYAIFTNLDEPGADVSFTKGGTHVFQLWDGFIHVLPKCIIDEFRDTSNPIGKTPIHGILKHPTIPEITASQIIGHRRRFGFEVLDNKPPANAAFGVVLNHKIYKQTHTPYPETAAIAS